MRAKKNPHQGGSESFRDRHSISFSDVKQRARHQWPAILASLGIDPAFLRNKHMSCPACGGQDRYRFDDQGGHGTFYCNQCGAGDGFALLERVHGWTALEALQAVARWLGMVGYGPAVTASKRPIAAVTTPSPATIERMQAKIKAFWGEAFSLETPKAEVGRLYLEDRGLAGLSPFPQDIRLHLDLPYWFPGPDGKPIEIGRYPALLALVRNTDGKVRGLHRTYLQPDGQGKARVLSPVGEPLSAKKLLSIAPGATRGCAVQLYPVADGSLAIAEGIETALAVSRANSGWPCWAALFAGNLAQFVLPAGVKTIAIMMDNDANQVGQEAGKALARRLFRMAEPPVIKLLVPDRPGTDWLDQWGGSRYE